MKYLDASKLIREFHVHIYYDEGTRAHAADLRTHLQGMAGGRLKIYTLSDGPRGPHAKPMFGVDIAKDDLAEVLGFLMLNHGPLAILLHPESDHAVLDHSHHAFWLGQPQPINLAVLR